MHKDLERKRLRPEVSRQSTPPKSDFFRGLWTVPEKKPERGSILILAENSACDLYRTVSLENERIELSFLNAWASHLEKNIDVLILDCAIERKTGLRLLRDIKQARPDVPVIFLAEGEANEIEAESLRAGARFFLAKPVNIFDLLKLTETLLAMKRNSREKRSPVSFANGAKSEGLELATTDKPASILRVIQHIEENISDKLTLDGLSRVANLSKFHFCRFFYKYTGMSPMKFVSHLRIEKAKEYFKGNASVSEVTFQVGFNDMGTFIRQFKNHTGMTPSLFQESLRGAGAARL